MRVLGVDLPRTPAGEDVEQTIVLLDPLGAVARVERLSSLLSVATEVGRLSGGEPFLLGVNTPVVVPGRQSRARPVENVVRRRLGFRMPPGGRAALASRPGGVAGESLLVALGAAGQPCLPYPDRNRRTPCLAEIHAPLVLKSLLWQSSSLAEVSDQAARDELFRAYGAPVHRAPGIGSRTTWAQQAATVDLILGALGSVEDYDLGPARDALVAARTRPEVERAAALLDATLIAGTARRYLETPESCVFLGDQENGYVILPADEYVRRLSQAGAAEPRSELFPQQSLSQRLGEFATVRSASLPLPDRPQRTEARFKVSPRYEFDNLDEMMWWKHCRHLEGPALPTEGLRELFVALDPAPEGGSPAPLKLARSRHRTLSFRFEPPAAWREHVPTRDGKTYPFVVLRAVYETAPQPD